MNDYPGTTFLANAENRKRESMFKKNPLLDILISLCYIAPIK